MRRDERLEMIETRKTEEFDLFHRKIDLVLQKPFFNEKIDRFIKKSISRPPKIDFFHNYTRLGEPICASYSFENVSVGEIWGVGNLGGVGKSPGESCGKNMGKYWGNQGESGGKSGGIWGNLEGIWGVE